MAAQPFGGIRLKGKSYLFELKRQTEEELRKLLHEPGSQVIPPPAKAA
jgi:hypothetical protein